VRETCRVAKDFPGRERHRRHRFSNCLCESRRRAPQLAVQIARRLTEALLTCEPILAEAAFHLESVPVVLAMLADGLVALAFNCADHLPQLSTMARRYADRRPDLADLCIIRMSEVYPRRTVITIDRADFRVYRRNKREVIPLICPPEGGS
jgi:hypothetical protein